MTKGKKRLVFLLLLPLVPAFCLVTAWADVTDSCDSLNGPGSYQQLALPEGDPVGWDSPPDQDYLCQESSRRRASATYQCPGAREVQVAIYSRYGSHAAWEGDTLVRGGDQLPLGYQPSTEDVYCDGMLMAYDADLGEFVFLETEERPSGLVPYGLGVYSSRDGTDYSRVSCQLVSAQWEGPGSHWYEVYQAELEEGTRYLRLTLTDQSSIQLARREERYSFDASGGLCLASVEITGEEEPEPPREPSDEGPPPPEDPGPDQDPGPGEWEDDPDSEDDPDADDDWIGDDDWNSADSWADAPPEQTPPPGTGSLPAYRPGQEEGDGPLLWGPLEDPEDGEPAFPDEWDEEDEPIEEPPEEAVSPGSSSSAAGTKGNSQKKPSSTTKGEKPPAQQTPDAEPASSMIQGKHYLVRDNSPPETRYDIPLWHRIQEPEAMSVLIISFTMVALGIRILWERGLDSPGSRKRTRRHDWCWQDSWEIGWDEGPYDEDPYD